MPPDGWIGVDLDGTLAEYEQVPDAQWDPMKIGKPIPLMVDRIRRWLADGWEIRILTARVAHHHESIAAIQAWLVLIADLPPLKVQAHKDYQMVELWDDRAVRVVKNTGYVASQREFR